MGWRMIANNQSRIRGKILKPAQCGLMDSYNMSVWHDEILPTSWCKPERRQCTTLVSEKYGRRHCDGVCRKFRGQIETTSLYYLRCVGQHNLDLET